MNTLLEISEKVQSASAEAMVRVRRIKKTNKCHGSDWSLESKRKTQEQIDNAICAISSKHKVDPNHIKKILEV